MTETVKDNIIETVDEDGKPIKFELINMIDFEGKDYALLMPYGEDKSEELILMEIIKDGEDYSFALIEDDDEFERVSDYIESLDEEE